MTMVDFGFQQIEEVNIHQTTILRQAYHEPKERKHPAT